MKKNLEKSELTKEKLVCVPSGLISKEGKDIMSWTLKECLVSEESENLEIHDIIEYPVDEIENTPQESFFGHILPEKIFIPFS